MGASLSQMFDSGHSVNPLGGVLIFHGTIVRSYDQKKGSDLTTQVDDSSKILNLYSFHY